MEPRHFDRATSLCVTLHKGTLMHTMRACRSAGGCTELERLRSCRAAVILSLVFHEAWLLSGAPKRKNAPELG